MKNRPSILPVILLLLAGCNLPVTDGPDAAPQGITPTGGIFLVSVSAATDFRAGPGEMYDSLGILNPGQTFEAIGQTSDGEYLLIRDPAQPAMLFWISNDFVILDEDP
ncbi:MAG: hypothetical protein FJZ96_05380, partial [Chloroflexi bacterium]|nr:hypothetical protein [Chloroflexota bacterium]